MTKTAIITGASAGIGADAARGLVADGFCVCLMARRKERLEAVAADLRKQTPDAGIIVCAGDVTCDGDRRRCVDAVMDAWGRVDILVNNAGYALAGVVEDVPLDEVRKQFEVNTLATLAMMQLVGPLMRKQRSGRIINISSISGLVAIPGIGIYAASKFAVEALSDAARREYAPWGIKLSLIEPGGIGTDIWHAGKDCLKKRMSDPNQSAFAAFYKRQSDELDKLIHGGYPVEIVTKAIRHAASARKPKIRYCMPQVVRNRRLMALLPARLQDWIISKYVKTDGPA